MKKILARLPLILILLQLLVILVSWLIAAAQPQLAIHSLLSSEGLRWLFASLAGNIATPVLACLLLAAMAYGAITRSGIASILHPATYRQRFARKIVIVEAALLIAFALLLTAVPHAVLLSVTGVLFPSSFSDSFFPILCIVLMVVSLTYGIVCGTIATITMAFESLKEGIKDAASLILIYIFSAELYAMLGYVFG